MHRHHDPSAQELLIIDTRDKSGQRSGEPERLASCDHFGAINGFLLTVVEDTGCGIKESELESLFSMFNRKATSYFTTSGIGIGLSTVKTLTKAMQGAVHLRSIEGLGTEVGFSVMTSD